MSAAGRPVFDKTLHETNQWLMLMMGELGTDTRSTAFSALRASLHALRDRIGIDNAAHLGAQLPMLLRGAFRERHLGDFVDHVQSELPDGGPPNPAAAARACFCVMSQCLDPGEMIKVQRILPHEVLNLWPEEMLRA